MLKFLGLVFLVYIILSMGAEAMTTCIFVMLGYLIYKILMKEARDKNGKGD